MSKFRWVKLYEAIIWKYVAQFHGETRNYFKLLMRRYNWSRQWSDFPHYKVSFFVWVCFLELSIHFSCKWEWWNGNRQEKRRSKQGIILHNHSWRLRFVKMQNMIFKIQKGRKLKFKKIRHQKRWLMRLSQLVSEPVTISRSGKNNSCSLTNMYMLWETQC